MRSRRFHLVRPTVGEVRASAKGWPAGRQLPGTKRAVRAECLLPFWCNWGGSPAGRAGRIPHMKSYTRYACALHPD